jgi:hypothetical protein
MSSSSVNLLADGLEVAGDFFGLGLGQQAHVGQHAGMSRGAQNVVPVEPAIEADALGELLDPAVGGCRENAFPRLGSHPKTTCLEHCWPSWNTVFQCKRVDT